MQNFVKIALDEAAISPRTAAQRGMPYQSVYRQYRGQRKPSAEFALLYERILGIPREKIRPDLWASIATPTTPPEGEGAGEPETEQEGRDA